MTNLKALMERREELRQNMETPCQHGGYRVPRHDRGRSRTVRRGRERAARH